MRAEEILKIAAAEIGYTENPPNSNRTKYGEAYGLNGAPWCAIFVWWCFAQAHAQGLFYDGNKIAYCPSYVEWSKARGRWVTKDFRPGDIVFFNFDSSPAADHVGIVKSVGETGVYTIEGNTSSGNGGSQSNGGGVFRKFRKWSEILGADRPPYEEEDEKMKTVSGATTSETKMIKAIQSAVGAIADGEIGTQTISDIACKLGADCFPLTVEIYGAPVIIAKNIVPFAGKGQTLSGYNNVINGSFYANGQPCSILVQDGIVKQKYACHASHGKPESVLYRLKNGTVGMARVHNTDELPDTVRGNLRWAVGGMGLLDNYNPTAEGFCKCTTNGVTQDFSDVLRDTNHSMLGYKNGYFYLVYCKSMTGAEVNTFAKKLGLTYALLLDGGHVAGINGAESFAKINTTEKQYYMVQGEKVK